MTDSRSELVAGGGSEGAPAERGAWVPRLDRRWVRAFVLLTGLLLPAWFLFGSALLGRTVLLPLDTISFTPAYLGRQASQVAGPPQNLSTSDAAMVLEPFRRFAVEEVRQGRWPLWNPYIFCGAPFLASNQAAVFSPYRVLDYLFPGPVVLAWSQYLKMIVAGLGAYLFFRGVMGVSFLPAAIGAWCYPLAGYMALWQCFPISAVMSWFPWLLLAIFKASRHPWSVWGLLLAMFTAAATLSGHSATAGQVLLFCGFFAVWCVILASDRGRNLSRNTLASVLVIGLGFALGLLLALPQLLPTFEYLGQSQRLHDRMVGQVETAAAGARALVQLVLPNHWGAHQQPAVYLFPHVKLEGMATGYAGFLAAMVLLPIGLAARQHRAMTGFWMVMGVIGIAQLAGLPGLGPMLESPPFNVFRNNRLTFLAGWAILVGAVAGLDAVLQRDWRWRTWHVALVVPCLILAAWVIFRLFHPHPLVVEHGPKVPMANLQLFRMNWPDMDQAKVAVLQWFHRAYRTEAVIAVLAACSVIALGLGNRRTNWRSLVVAGLGGAMVVELMVVNAGAYQLADRQRYYPNVPIVEALRLDSPVRVTAQYCMLPNMLMTQHLADIRGYDAVDPVRVIQTLELLREPLELKAQPFAQSLNLVVRMNRLLDMLAVSHVIVFQPMNPEALRAGDGFVATRRPDALPRCYVPRSVRTINDDTERLQTLRDSQFDPAQVALVESVTPLEFTDVQGAARIVTENPTHLILEAQMQTPGMIVLADTWDAGWHATMQGQALPIYRVNHMLRGVQVPAGTHRIELHYWPASFQRGLYGAGLAAILLVIWAGVIVALHRGEWRRLVPLDARDSPTAVG